MENIVEVIIALVVIGYSLFAERKQPPQNQEDQDLSAVEDFFKQQSGSAGGSGGSRGTPDGAASQGDGSNSASGRPTEGFSRSTEFVSLESLRENRNPPPLHRANESASMIGEGAPDPADVGSFSGWNTSGPVDSADQPPPKPKRQKKKEKSKGLDAAGRDTRSGASAFDEENFDRQPSLMGQRNQRSSAPMPTMRTRGIGNKKWDKRRILDAFIFSELMARYDINRIYARIPGTRRES